jgi:hypothetical protein
VTSFLSHRSVQMPDGNSDFVIFTPHLGLL